MTNHIPNLNDRCVLLIDTSTRTARVALERAGRVFEERTWEADRALGQGLLEKISEVLEVGGMSREEVDQIVVVAGGGGGSFMAQRTGMITAVMLGEAWKKEVAVRKPS